MSKFDKVILDKKQIKSLIDTFDTFLFFQSTFHFSYDDCCIDNIKNFLKILRYFENKLNGDDVYYVEISFRI